MPGRACARRSWHQGQPWRGAAQAFPADGFQERAVAGRRRAALRATRRDRGHPGRHRPRSGVRGGSDVLLPSFPVRLGRDPMRRALSLLKGRSSCEGCARSRASTRGPAVLHRRWLVPYSAKPMDMIGYRLRRDRPRPASLPGRAKVPAAAGIFGLPRGGRRLRHWRGLVAVLALPACVSVQLPTIAHSHVGHARRTGRRRARHLCRRRRAQRRQHQGPRRPRPARDRSETGGRRPRHRLRIDPGPRGQRPAPRLRTRGARRQRQPEKRSPGGDRATRRLAARVADAGRARTRCPAVARRRACGDVRAGTVPALYLFGVIRLPSGDWAFDPDLHKHPPGSPSTYKY